MSTKPLLVVVGATGTQGSSVVNTFLADTTWRIRGITRNSTSNTAMALTAKGVEMVQADLDDPASLNVAFSGATAIFGVTDFWQPFMNPSSAAKANKAGQTVNEWAYEYELQQGKNIFDAAAKVEGLERFVFSSLPPAKKLSGGKYTWVYHFDSKADVVEYGKLKYPNLCAKMSLIVLGAYLSNWLPNPFLRMKKENEDTYSTRSCVNPTSPWPYIATDEDTGPFVKALLVVAPGKNLIAYREILSGNDFRALWGKVMGKKWIQHSIPRDEYLKPMPEAVGKEIVEMFEWTSEFGYWGENDTSIVHPKDLGIPIQLPGTVEDWIRKQDWSRLPQ